MKVRIDALTRVEGEGALEVYLENGRPTKLTLSIYEPPRFIEGILRGKLYHHIPDITARICGICPIAYQMSGLQAIEDAFGVQIPEDIQMMRRLLYFGEWIQSHALHVFFLHLPDFFGVPSILELAKLDRDLVLAGMEIKKAGTLLIQTIGGRASHPVSPVPGGFSSLPDDLSGLVKPLQNALEKSLWALEKLNGLNYPDFELEDVVFVSLWEEDYPILKGQIYFEGQKIEPSQFKDYFTEFEVPHSTAKHSKLKDGRVYLVGVMARYNNAFEKLSKLSIEVAQKLNLLPPVRNPYRSLLLRMVELIHSLERSLEIVKTYRKPSTSRVEVHPRESEGFGVSEAPRGILWHHYSFDSQGRILTADIIPPTSQNQPAMELSLWQRIQSLKEVTQQELQNWAEPMVRNYDPCISCATHFLRVQIKGQ